MVGPAIGRAHPRWDPPTVVPTLVVVGPDHEYGMCGKGNTYKRKKTQFLPWKVVRADRVLYSEIKETYL